MMRLAIAALVVATAHAGTTQEGKDFLAAKAKEEGVVTLASGMSYKVLTAAPAGATKTIDLAPAHRSAKVESFSAPPSAQTTAAST